MSKVSTVSPGRSITVLGHYCHDTVFRADGSTHESLGGSPAFIAAVLRAAQVPFSVIAKVGNDFKYSEQVLKAVGHVPLVDVSARTTAFLADFRNGTQKQKILERCTPFSLSDVERYWHAKGGVALLTGVVGEISPELIQNIRARADVVIADIQGFIRTTDSEGWLRHKKIEDTAYANILGLIDYLKVSEDEAKALNFSCLPRELTVLETSGPRGTRVHRQGEPAQVIPSYRVDEVDPTGAGDSFVAGLAIALGRGDALPQAIAFANRCGALAVQKIGVPNWTPDEFLHAQARLV